jgi:3-hydroxyisobutyrate dehydrogenase-like beta-hydroxyacid dehydrogenase
LLEAIGRKLFVIGSEPYSANAVKLAGNFLIASMLEALSEAVVLTRKCGVEQAKFLEIVNGSFFQSPIYENYGNIIIGERFSPPGFALRLGLKDTRLVLSAAEEAGVPMPVASVIRDHFVSAVARGWQRSWLRTRGCEGRKILRIAIASDHAGPPTSPKSWRTMNGEQTACSAT